MVTENTQAADKAKAVQELANTKGMLIIVVENRERMVKGKGGTLTPQMKPTTVGYLGTKDRTGVSYDDASAAYNIDTIVQAMNTPGSKFEITIPQEVLANPNLNKEFKINYDRLSGKKAPVAKSAPEASAGKVIYPTAEEAAALKGTVDVFVSRAGNTVYQVKANNKINNLTFDEFKDGMKDGRFTTKVDLATVSNPTFNKAALEYLASAVCKLQNVESGLSKQVKIVPSTKEFLVGVYQEKQKAGAASEPKAKVASSTKKGHEIKPATQSLGDVMPKNITVAAEISSKQKAVEGVAKSVEKFIGVFNNSLENLSPKEIEGVNKLLASMTKQISGGSIAKTENWTDKVSKEGKNISRT